MRLIDADELLKDAEDYSPFGAGLADIYDVQWLVRAQTTVDAVEVVHGRWIPIRNKKHGYYMGLLCSECGHKATNKGGNYCPNCGADMRERKDNETD